MVEKKEKSEKKDEEAFDDKSYQGTSKGVTGERNSTSHKVIFVDNLPPSMDKKGFINLFRGYGVIIDFKFLKHKTGAETGYGFVEFSDWEDGRRAIHELNWKLIGDRSIRVSRAKPPTMKVSMTNLYVENVPKSWNDETIKAYFSRFCKISHARILVNLKNGESRGVGFVHCYNNDHAKAAIQYVNVENRGREGELNLFVKFAKVSNSEREYQDQRLGSHGNHERQKWLSRSSQVQNNLQKLRPFGITRKKKVTQHDWFYLKRGTSHDSQRQNRNGGRSPKFSRKKSLRKNYDKERSKVSRDSFKFDNSKEAMDAAESVRHHTNSSMAYHRSNVPVQTHSSILTQVPRQGMIAAALPQISYPSDQELMNRGNSSKINQGAPNFQIPSIIIPQLMPNTGLGAGASQNYHSQQVLYPNTSCITPVFSSRTASPYQWSPMVKPLVGTPVRIGSPVSYYANMVETPTSIPTDLHTSRNQITSPRNPGLLAWSELLTPNSSAQPNTICWTQAPLTLNRAQSLANSFAVHQQMANLSLRDGRFLHSNCDLEEREPTVGAKKFSFPTSQAEGSSTRDKLTSAYRSAGMEGTSITASSSPESNGGHDEERQYAYEEKQSSEEVSKMSSSVGPGGRSTQNSCPGSVLFY